MNLSHWFVDTVTIARSTGVGSAGDPSFAAQTTIKARVEYGGTIVASQSGEEIRSDVSIASHEEIKNTDRIWLPGANTADTGESRRPIQVKRAKLPGDALELFEAYL